MLAEDARKVAGEIAQLECNSASRMPTLPIIPCRTARSPYLFAGRGVEAEAVAGIAVGVAAVALDGMALTR